MVRDQIRTTSLPPVDKQLAKALCLTRGPSGPLLLSGTKYPMTAIFRSLNEGIRHIEDLPVDEFIAVLQNMHQMVATEKMDGANLWFGLDEDGKLFASREGKRKGADRKYSPDDWAKVGAFNQFKAAHAALKAKEEDIKKVLRPGDTVEAEVLYGRQPNSVIYGADGKSYITILRGVNDTPDAIARELSDALSNQEVPVSVSIVDTEDGEKLNDVSETTMFKFVKAHELDGNKLKHDAEIDAELEKLDRFLSAESSIEGMTNDELLNVNLQQVPKDRRADIKAARTETAALVQTTFKLPIKQSILDKVVRKIRSTLTDKSVSDEDDIGVEGIVLRDADGNQIKIVDKDIFTTINKFNQAPRQAIQSAMNTLDPDASVESRGGLMGELRIRIAELLGNRELAKPSGARKAMEPLRGETVEQTIKNFADSMQGIDDFEMVQKKILAMISDTAKTLKLSLDEFKKHQDDYHLKLKNGKEMNLSPDTIKKTLLTFAEARRNLSDLFDKVKSTNNLAQLLAVLYGGSAKAVNASEEQIEESLILAEATKKKRKKEKTASKGDIDRHDYENLDTFQLVNKYLATVFNTMLIFHEGDVPGMRFLRDRKNMGMNHWSHDMSPLNHWGYVIWRSGKPDVKKQLTKKTQHEVFTAVRKIVPSGWRFLHMDFSYSKDVKVDWDDHRKTLQRLIDLTGLRSERVNSLLDWMIRWPELSHDEKVKAIGKLYMYTMQFTPKSRLFVRLRVIQQNLLINANGTNADMVIEGSLLKSVTSISEEDGGNSVEGTPVTAVASTTSADIEALPKLVGNKQIIRRKRNPEVVKKLLMKFPDPNKDTE